MFVADFYDPKGNVGIISGQLLGQRNENTETGHSSARNIILEVMPETNTQHWTRKAAWES